MLNKFLTDVGPGFDLPNVTVLGILGPDAISFANSQFMNDITVLRDGEWHWNGWLNTKGRVLCLFALVRISEAQLLLVLPDYPARDLGVALTKLLFRSQVQIGVWSELHATGYFSPAPFSAANAVLGDFSERDIALDMGASEHPRILRLSTPQSVADAASAAQWRAMDVRFGLPRLDPVLEHAWTPQQLSLQNLRAFSVKKGCYPGQEIVARTHFLGKSKRDLVLLRNAGDVAGAVSTAVWNDDVWTQVVTSIDAPVPPEAVAFWPGLAR